MIFKLSQVGFTDCSEYASVVPSFIVSQPPVLNVHDNTTLLCTALAVTKNASLVWVVDGVVYNSTGIFSSSRGLVLVEGSLFDGNLCRLSLSLTLFNVQSSSQGVYTCIVQEDYFTVSKNVSVTLHTEDSTDGLFHSLYASAVKHHTVNFSDHG